MRFRCQPLQLVSEPVFGSDYLDLNRSETNRATRDPIRVVERVGAREVIGRRHADEGGLVRAAGETADP